MMKVFDKKLISVLIATYNSEKYIAGCLESLKVQSCKDFDVYIADGDSSDNTVKIINSYKKFLNINVISGPDKGIHDAINKLINKITTPFYVIVGSDDRFYSNAIQQYSNVILKNNYDLITFPVDSDGYIFRPRKSQLRFGQLGHISQHSVGVAINKKLHKRFGLYDQKFFIGADSLFILSCVNGGATIYSGEKAIGYYSSEGLSSTNYLHAFFEFHKIQLITYRYFFVIFIFFILKLIFNYTKLKKENIKYFDNLK